MAQSFNELAVFAAIARERSFTQASAKLGVTPSALSQTLKGLEEKLGLRLLTRTTNSVAPTEAGERLLQTIAPRFEEIEQALAVLGEIRERPVGAIRIAASEHAEDAVLRAAVARLLSAYPDIRVEIFIDHGVGDLVFEEFDAVVRLGEHVAKDMRAVRIGPDIRMAVVGSASYFSGHERPRSPQDLTGHNCINTRLPNYAGLQSWDFERDGRIIKVHVDGQLIVNTMAQRLEGAMQGLGLAYLPRDVAEAAIASGDLVCVLEDCSPLTLGHHLHYLSRLETLPAFSALLAALQVAQQ